MVTRNEPTRYEGVEYRLQFTALGMAAAFVILALQCWNLQVIRTEEFTAMATDNQITTIKLPSNRGIIYGRNGEILADNRASTDVVIVPGECKDSDGNSQLDTTLPKLARLLNISEDALRGKIENQRSYPFSQIVVKQEVSDADRIRIEEHSYALPGVFTDVKPQRRYLHGETGGQLLGYLGLISPTELETWGEVENYDQNDWVGKGGLERMYESSLRSFDGSAVVTQHARGSAQLRTGRQGNVVVASHDTRGHIMQELADQREDPIPGQDLHTTLDIDLQRYCEELLKGIQGSIVVLEVDTGGVLAMASSPSNFDPTVFVSPSRSGERQALLTQKPSPMRNRSYQENSAPGSVFKIMVAVAALEEGIVNKDTTYFCGGRYQGPSEAGSPRCHGRHGQTDMINAIAYSCDVYFYNVGNKMGIDKIHEWALKMGYGEKTGLDLPGEVAGIMPNKAWKQNHFRELPRGDRIWFPVETLHASIGQGYVTTTPLQNAVMIASVLNGGKVVVPHLAQGSYQQPIDLGIKQSTLDLVIAGMRKCITDPNRGTGRHINPTPLKVIGKTGTAQIAEKKHTEHYEDENDIPMELRDDAWFACSALDVEPRISVCIYYKHGLHGGTGAGPYGKKVLEYFYGREEQDAMVLAQGGAG